MERFRTIVGAVLLACAGGAESAAPAPDADTVADAGAATDPRAARDPLGAGERDVAYLPGVAYPRGVTRLFATAPLAAPAITVRILRVSYRAGGGDAILVSDSSVVPPRHVLIDAGDDGAAAAALRALGVRSLDLLVLTHAHYDHYGGMDEVLETVPVGAFAFTGQVRTAVTYRRLLARIGREVPVVLLVDSVRRVRLGEDAEGTRLVLVPPLPSHLGDGDAGGEELNDGSLAVRLERGTFSFLTTGDAEEEANRRFARRYPELVDVDVLKLGHHGSSDATQPFWLDATTPAVAIVSANGTTHPHGAVLNMVRRRGIELYCTPQHGAVSVRISADGTFAIHTERPARIPCAPGSER